MRNPMSFVAAALLASLSTAAAASPVITATGQATIETRAIYTVHLDTGRLLSTTLLSNVGPSFSNDGLKGLGYAADGTLFAFTQVPSSQLYTIDPATGEGAAVGDPFLVQAFEGGIAMIDNEFAYIANGNTAAENYLLIVNLVTGFVDIAAPIVEPVDISAMDMRSDGMLVGLDTRNLEQPERLVTIDPATGAIETIRFIDSTQDGVSGGMVIRDDIGFFAYSGMPGDQNAELWKFDPYTGDDRFLSELIDSVELTGLALHPDISLACPGNTDLDDAVDVDDLLVVIGGLGQATQIRRAGGDIDGSGVVDVNDLLAVIGNLGESCP